MTKPAIGSAALSAVAGSIDDLLTPDDAFASFLDPSADASTVPPGAGIETVGVGQEFATLSAAIAAAANGTIIYVGAGTYTNDFATVTSSISIIGVGGMVNLVATIPPPNLKGILTVDNNVTIENVSFSGAAIDAADGGNGAGGDVEKVAARRRSRVFDACRGNCSARHNPPR